jgi:fructokinase
MYINFMWIFTSPIRLLQSRFDIITIGEIVGDFIASTKITALSYGNKFTLFPGGSCSNLAVNLAKLGYNSGIVSAIGNDTIGNWIHEYLKASKVDVENVNIIKNKNTSIVIILQYGEKEKFIPYRDADKEIDLNKNAIKTIFSSKILHTSTWPLSVSNLREKLVFILNRARVKGIITSLEANFRPILWETPQPQKDIKNLLQYFDIVKASIDDAKHIFGKDLTRIRYVKEFHLCGAKLILLTLGKNGLIASNGKEIIEIPAMGSGKNSVGAGDAFLAGFFGAILQSRSIKSALYTGMALASIKLGVKGSTLHHSISINEILEKFKIS